MLATSQLHLLLELADNSQAYIKHQTFFEVLVITTRTISYRILRTCHSGSAPPRKKDQKSRPKQAYFPCVSMWFHVFSSFFPRLQNRKHVKQIGSGGFLKNLQHPRQNEAPTNSEVGAVRWRLCRQLTLLKV